MTPERPILERRVLAALEATPSRVPVLLGGCGSGRSSVLLRLRDLVGRGASQYVDVERVATTPERFLQSLVAASPFAPPQHGPAAPAVGSARDAFDATLAFLSTARASGGGPATFLLDEALELRTFENFPGLRSVLRDLVDALSASPNRFVLTTRYVARAHRLLRDAPAHFEVIHVPPLTRSEIAAAMARGASEASPDRDELARVIHSLADGRPAYVAALTEALGQMQRRGGGDAVSALVAQIARGGGIETACRFCYELRLHRARGYGALKAILDVLAEEEPLTLTEIATRLRRTPGSTKDYLSWLEDVDLVTSRQKRYSFGDPMLRLWVRLHCRPVPPGDDDLAREVQAYTLARLPRQEPSGAPASTGAAETEADRGRPWGIIEID
jgi:hypothetical protein